MKALFLVVLLTVSASCTGRPATRPARQPTSSSSPPAPTRPPVTPTLLPQPPTPSHSTSKFLHPRRSANPWTVEFGGCTFSGDYDGAPLVRTGSSCASGALILSSSGITSVAANAFQGMSLTWVFLCVRVWVCLSSQKMIFFHMKVAFLHMLSCNYIPMHVDVCSIDDHWCVCDWRTSSNHAHKRVMRALALRHKRMTFLDGNRYWGSLFAPPPVALQPDIFAGLSSLDRQTATVHGLAK